MFVTALILMACSEPTDAPLPDTMTAPEDLAGRYTIDRWLMQDGCPGGTSGANDITASSPSLLRLVPIDTLALQATTCEPGGCMDGYDPHLEDAELFAIAPGEWVGSQILRSTLGEGEGVCTAWRMDRQLLEDADGHVQLIQTTHGEIVYPSSVEGLCELEEEEEALVQAAPCVAQETLDATWLEGTDWTTELGR